MPDIELSAGTIDYIDNGGPGPVLIFGHGPPMTPTQWRKVLPLLEGYRCILPTLPMGGHCRPMRPEADLSQFGIARLLGELLERVDLADVTLILNDWGGGQFLLTEHFPGYRRIGRLVLVACEAFDNMPPGAAKPISRVAAVPGGMWALLQLLRVPAVRHHRLSYGGLSLTGVPDDVLADWFRPAWASRDIRRDFAKFAIGAPRREVLLACSQRLQAVRIPALIVWANQDRFMPHSHGLRLANLLPAARLVHINDSATLVPEDQPERLAEVLIDFLIDTGAAPAHTSSL